MPMNSLSLTDEEVAGLMQLLDDALTTSELKRQAVIVAHGGKECVTCLRLFDLKHTKIRHLHNKLKEFVP